MPLMRKASKKALKENIETEMSVHPGNRAQNLAIAYNVQKQAKKKKMAEGGMAKDDSAKTESRPMPSTAVVSEAMDHRNSGKKTLVGDKWTDRPTKMQALKGPRMTNSNVIKAVPVDALGRRMNDEEKDLEMTDAPAAYDEQPPDIDNEMDAKKSGAPVKKSPIHSANLNKYARGGMINEDVSMHDAEEDEVEHPAGLESDNDQMRPPEDEIMESYFAEGGEVAEDEEHADLSASIASAIMSKLKAAAMLDSGSEDEDKAERMAEGGEVMGSSDSLFDVMNNNKEEPNFYPPRNGAVLKENYNEDIDGIHQPEDSNEHSPEHAEEDGDDRSIVSSIRRKMKMKSPITK